MQNMLFICFLISFLNFGYREVKGSNACKQEKNQQFIRVSQDGLAEVNPFKRTTVTSPILCSFKCADNMSCLSFVFLKQTAIENCLLSTDPNGGSSSEDSETFKVTVKYPSYDQTIKKCQKGGKMMLCSEGDYRCECPPWAAGKYCENLNMDYNLDLLPWKKGDGYGIRVVDISFTETWCVSNSDDIFHLQNGKWDKVYGRLYRISVGENGLWGTTSNKWIYTRNGITATNPKGTQWYHDPSGLLDPITSGPPGILWGINLAVHEMFYKHNGVWGSLGGSFKWVSCGKFGCWAITTGGNAYFRTGVTASVPGGTSWVNTGVGTFTQLDTGVQGDVYAVENSGQLYTREGISEELPYGQKWSKFGNRLLSHVSVGYNSVIGVAEGNFYTLHLP